MLTRNVQMNIRVTAEEKKLFELAAARCGLTLSQYIRMRLHNQMPRQLPNADYRQVLDALTALYQKDNTPEVQREILETLLTVQRAVTVPQKEE
ncbi:toxin-antitoxin system protein [uncultured Subdoligranulum sp.]|uniref:plasmid mobilization protein n=1 Tax=uncultured Subdoligranulum sp. TaxID=512298 RepID=UPI002629CE40|nr:toxin-antitoxin system protein [uncultured Subdoligranulum sp.]